VLINYSLVIVGPSLIILNLRHNIGRTKIGLDYTETEAEATKRTENWMWVGVSEIV